MASELLSRYGEQIEVFRLVPAEHGKFHVYINGDLALAHAHRPDQHYFPDLPETLTKVRQALGVSAPAMGYRDPQAGDQPGPGREHGH